MSGFILLALLGVLIAFLPSLLGLKKIEIPDVIDLPEVEAITILEEEGFKIKESIEEYADEIEAGNVVKINPEAGKLRPKGTEITLYVSMGKELIEMDSYIGEDYEQVASLLGNYGYKSIEPEYVYSDEPSGTIIDQDPTPGTEVVLSETDLVFTVSSGKEQLAVQDLTGYSESEIREYEKKSGLEIIIDDRENSNSTPEGHVISQRPSAGTKVEKGQKVSVVISKGKEQQPIKHIIQTVMIPYTADVDKEDEDEDEERDEEEQESSSKVPQSVRVYIQDRNHSMTDPYEEFTITEDREVTIEIELEEGGRGAYRIMRDDVQVEEKTFNYDDED